MPVRSSQLPWDDYRRRLEEAGDPAQIRRGFFLVHSTKDRRHEGVGLRHRGEKSREQRRVSEDPRWQEAIRLLERLKAAEGTPADNEFADGFQRFIATLEAIAVDPGVASQERASAQRLLDKMAAIIRGHAPELIRKVAEMAGDATAAPDARAEARRLLDDITERMPAASDK